MTFVRLAGCNAPELGLGCLAWCDTRESWDGAGGRELEVTDVVCRVDLPRVCITGGEPLLQADAVAELASRAQGQGIRVHLETNGTLGPPPDPERLFDWVAVGPKPPGYVVSPEWTGGVDELKVVVDRHLEPATVERLAAATPEAVVFLQPQSGPNAAPGVYGFQDERYRESCRRAVALVIEHSEWRLSLQIHKFLGIP